MVFHHLQITDPDAWMGTSAGMEAFAEYEIVVGTYEEFELGEHLVSL